ncbi:uncharacterized protein LOC143212777 [Lasioglossum baleicum]|uniref:uncharacterized protein LOC143212777 n=1 Tax=Lasioglossum baleicum TaxID=434251 RepID=UPI003FCE7EBD
MPNTVRTTCPFCKKQFKHPKKVYKCELEQHKVNHRSDYLFKCNSCKAKYMRKDSPKRQILCSTTSCSPATATST